MARNLYIVPNPDGSDPAAYVNIKIERAPDAAGVPGTFAQIASILIDTSEENTEYLDDTGALTSWYKHRFSTVGDATFSDYSSSVQLGDYLPRQWCKNDISDTDITDAKWDIWRDQTIQDMALFDLGRDAAIQSITPSSYTDEWKNLNAEIRTVTRVDIYDTSGYYVTYTPMWEQRGRRIRIVDPMPTVVYKIYGNAEIRGFNDLDDELFTLLYWGMRQKYLHYRLGLRSNFRKYLSSSKGEEVSTAQLLQMKKDADLEWNIRLSAAQASKGLPLNLP